MNLALEGVGLMVLGFCLGFVYRGIRDRKKFMQTIRTVKAVK